MSTYTKYISDQAEVLSLEDDDFEVKLTEIASSFRAFPEAFTNFMVEHGYSGNPDSVEEKSKYLRDCYKVAEIEDRPRDFKKWFKPGFMFDRKTIFPLLFALKLDLLGANDFFRRVRHERGFDYHTATEAIYYFCIKKGLSYSEAKAAINQVPKMESVVVPEKDVLYTSSIVDFLDSVDNLSEVVTYICQNQFDFEYNNVTAMKYIQALWSDITGENGLVSLEGKMIESANGTDFKEDNFVIAKGNDSAWKVYTQILGLDNYTEKKYGTKAGRTLLPVFKDNVLLPLRSADCFPHRESIEALMRNENKDHEVYRKMLILLVFYKFWAERIKDQENVFLWAANKDDKEKSLDLINQYLLEAGYPELYAGNPYDWIFIWSIHDDNPLYAFRFYIGEVFAINSEKAVE